MWWDHTWGFIYICTLDVHHIWLHLAACFPQLTVLPWNSSPSLPVTSSPFIHYLLAKNCRLNSVSFVSLTGVNSYFAGNFNSLELKIKHRYIWSASVQGMNTQNIESKKYAAICSNRSGLWPTGQIDAFLPQNPFFSRHIRESFEVPGFSSIKRCSCCKSTLRQHKTLTIYNTRPCFSEKRCI